MNSYKIFACFLASLVGLATAGLAQTVPTQATVARVTGAATVTLPDGSTTILTAGMKVAQGATITTGIDGDVYLESHAGYVTAIKAGSVVAVEEISVTTENSQVKEEKTLLDLKSGDLVARLDPKKKAVNNYQVRTPQGVAAARGTTFTVQFRGGSFAIAVVNGAVSITQTGGTPQFVAAGGAASVNAAGALTSGQADSPEVSQLLALAVASVAVAAQNGIAGITTAEVTAVAAAVFAAAPSAAAQAGALITQSTQGQNNSAVVNAVLAGTPPAQQAAFNQGVQSGVVAPPPSAATPAPGGQQSTPPTNVDAVTISRSN